MEQVVHQELRVVLVQMVHQVVQELTERQVHQEQAVHQEQVVLQELQVVQV